MEDKAEVCNPARWFTQNGSPPEHKGGFDSTGLSRRSLLDFPPDSYSLPVFPVWISELGKRGSSATVMSYFTAQYWLTGKQRIERSTEEIISGIMGFYCRRTVSGGLAGLHENGWLEKPFHTPQQARRITVSIRGLQEPCFVYKICQWCMRMESHLEDHHYPISRLNGGTETVSICHNCHALYHHIKDDRSHRASAKAMRIIESMTWLPKALWERFADTVHIDEGSAYAEAERA